jgi:hypothetical protein
VLTTGGARFKRAAHFKDIADAIVDVFGHRAGRVDVADEAAKRVVVEALGARNPGRRPQQHGSHPHPANESVGRSALFDRDAFTSVITPPPLWGRRRGFAEHCSAPPQPARDAARAVEWVGGEGAIVAHEFVKSLRKHMARAVSRLCWHLRAWMPPLPQPLPREGGGEYIGTSQHFHSHPIVAVRARCGEVFGQLGYLAY